MNFLPDPVDLLVDELRVQREVGAPGKEAAGAWLLLNTLTDAGWRIVRTDPGTEAGERVIVLEEWTGG
jgi:hypothetical protein